METKNIILFQSIFYLITAIWPLIHIRSFEMVSGEKKEDWLVYTVSVLLLGSGAVFLYASLYSEIISKEVFMLAVLNAAGLTLIDVIYVWKKIIRKVYLADAFVEICLIASLFASLPAKD